MLHENIRVESVDRDHCIAVWHNVVISVWRSEPSAERLKRLLAMPARLPHPTGLFSVIVVEDRCPVPDDAGRTVAIQFIKELREHNGKGIALVFEGVGFLAAASRAVMLGLMTASRVSVPYKVEQTVDQAEAFFRAEAPSGPFAPGRLVGAVEAVRKQIQNSRLTAMP